VYIGFKATYLDVYIYVQMCVYMYISMHTYTQIYIYVYAKNCLYTCMNKYIRIYTYAHTHIYTHTHEPDQSFFPPIQYAVKCHFSVSYIQTHVYIHILSHSLSVFLSHTHTPPAWSISIWEFCVSGTVKNLKSYNVLRENTPKCNLTLSELTMSLFLRLATIFKNQNVGAIGLKGCLQSWCTNTYTYMYIYTYIYLYTYI